jgi:hypothetical protein
MVGLIGLLIVGIVVAIVMMARRGGGAQERGDHLRRLVRYTILLGSLAAASYGVSRLITVVLPQGVPAARRMQELALGLALVLVAGSAWMLLWRSVVRDLRSDPRERGSTGWGLYLVAATAGSLIAAVVNLVRAGDALTGAAPFAADAPALAVVAVAVWGSHTWLLHHPTLGPTSELSRLAALIGAAVGLATAAVAGGIAVGTGLQWLLGGASPVRAAAHFSVIPAAVAAGAVGAAAWWYHWRVLGSAAPGVRTEPERAYDHLAAGAGLVAAAAGATAALAVAIRVLVAGGVAADDPFARDTLVIAITLLVVGVPLWWAVWHRIELHARTDPDRELPSPSRRVYLVLLFGATGVAAIGGLAVILYVVFREVFEGTLSVGVLDTLRVAIGLVVTAGAVSAYHWAVLLGDRAHRQAERAADVHPSRVLLLSPDGDELAATVAADTGARVKSLHRLDAPHLDVDAHAVADAILAVHHRSVIVTVDEDGTIHVIPYEPT